MGGSGIRIGSEGSDDMGDLSALAPQAPAPAPTRQRPEPGFFQRLVTPSPWEDRLVDSMFGNSGDVAAMADQPPSPVTPPVPMDAAWERRRDQAEAEMRVSPRRVAEAQKRITPETKAPKGPMLKGQMDTSSRPGTNPKTALPLYFAKAMGYAVPGESGDEEEARFAKAAHQALLKMTKGMSVARFLQSHQSPKTRDTFGKYLDAELAKNRQAPVSGGKSAAPTTLRAPGEEIPQS